MDFYYAPGSSSLAAHIMLREADIAFRPHAVDIFSHRVEDGSDFFRVNPNGYVPVLLLDDGTRLTENVAILDWLTLRAGSLEAEESARTRHLLFLAFMSSELHKQFIPLFFAGDEAERQRLRAPLQPRLRWIGEHLSEAYLLGRKFTGADAMLYVMLRWAGMAGVGYPDALDEFIGRVEQRNSVRAVLAGEGLEPLGRNA